jgi:hypothetical protein
MLPLLSIDEAARLGEKLGIDRPLATANIFRGLLNSPSATAGFYAVINALMFHNKVASRSRELIILRIGWRTASEYVFCNHVRIRESSGYPTRRSWAYVTHSDASPTVRPIARCSI